jgi:Fur family ferric uptake transcriptional regulator
MCPHRPCPSWFLHSIGHIPANSQFGAESLSFSLMAGVHANDVHQLAATRLAAHSQRYTANRRRLVDVLIGSTGPLTIAGILSTSFDLAQSSAYRNLVVLEEAGVVHRIITSDDHARFELTEAITGQHHHHLICDRCGMIYDVTLPADLEGALERSLAVEAGRLGFRGDHHRVDLVGVCESCEVSGAAPS